MGGAAGTLLPGAHEFTTEEEKYAFQLAHFDYEEGAIAIDRSPEATTTLTDQELFERVRHVFDNAVKERSKPILDCRCPAVIYYKWQKELNDDERADIVKQIVEVAVQRDKATNKKAVKASGAEDYSKSFGGTAMDTKVEKEAAEILRSTGGDDAGDISTKNSLEDTVYSILSLPKCIHPSEHIILRRLGKWTKYLSVSGCYLFLHPITRDIVSIRPEEYEEEADPASVKVDPNAIDPANGVRKVSLSDLPTVVQELVDNKKTPLIIDTSSTQSVRTFYTYKGHLEDISCLTIPFGKSGLKKEEVMERCRKRLVTALKQGKIFALYMGDLSIEHVDLKTKLCKKVRG